MPKVSPPTYSPAWQHVADWSVFSRTLPAVTTPHPAAPEGEDILAPRILDQARDQEVILDQIPQQKTTVMKPRRTMSPVMRSKAENLPTSE